jgi:transposase
LESLVRSPTAEVWQVVRALLLAADGVSNVEIAQRCEVSQPTVLAWRGRFKADGLTRVRQVAELRPRIVEAIESHLKQQ